MDDSSSIPRPNTRPDQPERFSLDDGLLQLSREDVWTVRDACEGTQIIGGSGAGKTSGSGRAIATACLGAMFGGLVLTSKKEEAELWEQYCRLTGRLGSLIRVTLTSGHRFDFLRYECNRPGEGAGTPDTVVPLLQAVVQAAQRDQHNSGRPPGGDPYWENALAQLLLHTVTLALFIAGRELSLDLLAQIVIEAPRTRRATRSTRWRKIIGHAQRFAESNVDRRNLAGLIEYFNREFPRLGEKTRSSITSMFTTTLAQIRHGHFGEMFASGKVNIVPELTHHGAIILLDIPVNEHGPAARAAQTMFKYAWQQATARRHGGDEIRPVFLWCDEAQDLVTAHDAAFQAKARSSRAATVYLTQSVPSYTRTLGEPATNALLGNFQTKIFHANGDGETNAWAERLLGQEIKFRVNESRTESPHSPDSHTKGTNESREPRVDSGEFTMLKKGGDGIVEGIAFQAGRVWRASGKNYLKVRFSQGGLR